MSRAAILLQEAVVAAIETHPVLNTQLEGVFDGPPPRATYPYVAIGDGLVSDWSTKSEPGREVRVALTVWDDGQTPSRLHDLIAHIDDAVATIPPDLPGWHIASLVFLRSMIARDPDGPWAGLVEYRARMLANT